MQQQAARIAGRMRGQNLAAQLAQLLKPGGEIARQLLVDLAAQLLREGGTLTGG